MVVTKNHFWLGATLALLSPMLAFVYYYYLKFYPVDFFLYFELLLTDTSHLRIISAMYLMLNSVLFFAYANSQKMRTAYGVFFVTLIAGLLTFAINVIWGG